MSPLFVMYEAGGIQITRPVLFQPKRSVCTQAAADLLKQTDLNPIHFLLAHQAGHWGDVCKENEAINNRGLKTGSMLVSTFRLVSDEQLAETPPAMRNHMPTVLVITDAALDSKKPLERHITTILCREDY